MISPKIRQKYSVTIGIECHVQLKTATKLFSAVGNDAREAPPNTLVSHIDFGMPGALPVLNQEAVRLAIRAAFALGVEPQTFSYFERKHYFYPDLPMGYQITQLARPIVVGGTVTFEVNDSAAESYTKTVNVNRVQMEADAGKSVHPAGSDSSLVDLNRAGTPLLEIVSEAEMHTAAEAKAYAKELYIRMRYADVSDCNLYYGNMRFDVNISVSKTDEWGTRTETKNINSFRAVEKTVEYETIRQIEVLEKGGQIVQETRGWDDIKQKTFSQRTKENADDYRYMPDPDLPPIELASDYVDTIRQAMPVMPDEWRRRLSSLGIDRSQIDVLLEANIEDTTIFYLALVEQSMTNHDFAKQLASWFVNLEIPLRRRTESANNQVFWADGANVNTARHAFYEAVFVLIQENKLSSTNAKALILKVLESGEYPDSVETLAESLGYIQESDQDAIQAIVIQVITDFPQAAADVQNGEAKAIGFLVGQIMKLSKGKANPQVAQIILKQKLGVQ